METQPIISVLDQSNVQPLVKGWDVNVGLPREHGGNGSVSRSEIFIAQTMAVQQNHTQEHLRGTQIQQPSSWGLS